MAELPGGALFLGDVRTIEVPLPAGHGAEVIVEINAGSSGGYGPSPPRMGLLVDDLRAD